MFTAAELDELISSGEVTAPYVNWKGETFEITVDWDELMDGREGVYTKFGLVSHVDDFGGMDQGSDYWVVVKVDVGDGTEPRLFRKEGYYASHDGGYLDGACFEVESFERTVTDYRRI